MKIQLTKDKTIEWTPPWEKSAATISDVVGIELGSGNPDGCPAVRLQRDKGVLTLVAAGFIPEPASALPSDWNGLGASPRWSLPSAFRAEHAAIAINSPDAFTRQTVLAALQENSEPGSEGTAVSKDGIRSVFVSMADTTSALYCGIPEYQALWVSRLFGDRRRPVMASAQTCTAATLAALTAQPGFCEDGDEFVVFIFDSSVFMAAYRGGIPLLYRDCPGVGGTAAMREMVKTAFGIDDSMTDTVFANNGIIDIRPALSPLLMPVVSQIEISIDYLKNRLGASFGRLILIGDARGCNAFSRIAAERLALPIHLPGAFDGIELPSRDSEWKERCCTGDAPRAFLTPLGAALSLLEGGR